MTRFAAIYLVAALACGALHPAGAAESAPSNAAPSATIDEAKSIVAKWVATQDLIFKERKSWQQEKVLLESRIELIEKETADLETKVAESRKVLSEQNAKRGQAAGNERRASGLSSDLTASVARFEDGIRRMHALLPDPAKEKIDALYRRIPADSEHTSVSVAERFQNVLGILNEVNKLNTEVTLATEVRPLSDGKPSEVKTVYLGLAQAYFISARGEAGIGRPGPEGWVWEPANELSKDINVVIQVLQNQAKPTFVPLPVTIQ
jgi:hypothetical protein